ncbi:hypothetical protein ACFW2D_20205 [Streptomyces sp. NPDC058914]|uniref:hypothetical protein n=1 Tax=Streptomyces sp. NPDC058914 TaxID=3346671 RepID=UPI00367382C6
MRMSRAAAVGRMEITVCRAVDVTLLDRHIGSPGGTSLHARRYAFATPRPATAVR